MARGFSGWAGSAAAGAAYCEVGVSSTMTACKPPGVEVASGVELGSGVGVNSAVEVGSRVGGSVGWGVFVGGGVAVGGTVVGVYAGLGSSASAQDWTSAGGRVGCGATAWLTMEARAGLRTAD